MLARITNLLLFLLLTHTLSASIYTFTGGAGDDQWSNPDNWDVYPGMTVQSNDIVEIQADCFVEFVHNEGTINTLSNVQLTGSIINFGTIVLDNQVEYHCSGENHGNITGDGTFYGEMQNYGYINISDNNGYIENFIVCELISNNGIIVNNGDLYCSNYGEVINNASGRMYGNNIDNFGRITSYGIIQNFTKIDNYTSLNVFSIIKTTFNNLNDSHFYISGNSDHQELFGHDELDDNITAIASMVKVAEGNNTCNFKQTPNATCHFDILNELMHDTLVVQDTAFLDGTLSLNLLDGYIPEGCAEWEIITADSVSGEFSMVDFPTVGMGNWSISYEEQSVTIHFLPTAENNAISLDGADDYIDIPHNIGASQTIEFMFNPAIVDPNSSGQVIMSFNNSSDQFIGYLDMLSGVSGETLVVQNGNGNAIYTDYNFTNDWYHIAIKSKSGLYRQIYVNGQLATSYELTNPSVYSINNMQISGTNSNNYFAGSLDEIRLWSSGRSDTEIYEYYDATIDPSHPDLSAVYQFDYGLEGENNSCANICDDGTSNMYHGTLMNFGLTGNNSNWVNFGCPTDMRTNTFLPASGDWSVASNWSEGIVPGPCHIVEIPSGATVNVEANMTVSCYSINVANGAIINIPSNSTLIIYGD